jgi:hypothetical protein
MGIFDIAESEHRVPFLLLIVLSLCSIMDIISTYLALSVGAREGNSIIANIINATGIVSPIFFYGYQLCIFMTLFGLIYFGSDLAYELDKRYVLLKEQKIAIRNFACVIITIILLFQFCLAIVNNFIIFVSFL